MPTTNHKQTSFGTQLRLALEHVHDPDWLHLHSPLAAPYFLGAPSRTWSKGGFDPQPTNGHHLQRVLGQALQALWPGSLPHSTEALLNQCRFGREEGAARAKYDFLLLDARYFHTFVEPQPLSKIWGDLLHVSKPSFYRHLEAAESRLGELLLQAVHPSVRLEQPPQPEFVVGRTGTVTSALASLQGGKVVTLAGGAGVGKTTVASEIARQWPGEAVFWYSVRSGFNNSLTSFIFALGNYLRRWGASTLWRQLIADGGTINDHQLALGLAQNELTSLGSQRPLLCLDQLDSAARSNGHRDGGAESEKLTDFFLELAESAPLLLVGGEGAVDNSIPISVMPFTRDDTTLFVRQIDESLGADEASFLHDYTAGNPRLLSVSLAGYRSGHRTGALSEWLPTEAALRPLLDHVFDHVSTDKRIILQTLSVFRSPAPSDSWHGDDGSVGELVASGLVQRDTDDGLSLAPSLDRAIYSRMTTEVREELHALAASMCAQRGEYTEATHHLLEAGSVGEAIELWFGVRHHEIRLGQAPSALATFRRVSAEGLKAGAAEKLAVLRAELNQLVGDNQSVVEDLDAVAWSPMAPLQLPAGRLRGDALFSLGRDIEALESYEGGIQTASQLIQEKVRLHTAKGRLLLDRHDHQRAHDEALRAQFEVEWLQGAIADRAGDYATARRHGRIALTLAEELDDGPLQARAHIGLGILAGRRADENLSSEHFGRAVELYEQLGDQAEVAKTWSNISAAHIQVGRFEASLEPAERAAQFAESTNNLPLLADSWCNLAEAHCELGSYSTAVEYAERALALDTTGNHPYALFTLGTALAAMDEAEGARQRMAEAVDQATANEDPFILAYALRSLSQMQEAQGAEVEAEATRRRADELFSSLGLAES